MPVRRISEWQLKFEMMRLRDEYRVAYFSGEQPAKLREKAAMLRKKLLAFHLKRTKKLAKAIQKSFDLLIKCGPHWQYGQDSVKYLKATTHFHYTLEMKEHELDSHTEDYPSLNFYVEYSQTHCYPSVDMNKLLAVMPAKVSVGMDGDYIFLVGPYENQHYHVRIHLKNEPRIKTKAIGA